MLHQLIPEDSYLTKKSDAGKKVIINSSGGAFIDEPGTIIIGPYVYPYVKETEIKAKVRNPMAQKRYKSEDCISNPLWLIEVSGKLFSFMASEFKFVRQPKK
jgi:hypothetical protein